MKRNKGGGALLGAAFLMATSAIGPGFLTQTAKFTGDYQASFGFVILFSIILSAIAQMNIWRVLCTSGLRGQDVANKVLPGLGYVVAFMIVLGGLVFNIGNVGGGALGFNTLLGIPTKGRLCPCRRSCYYSIPGEKCKSGYGYAHQGAGGNYDRGNFRSDRDRETASGRCACKYVCSFCSE